MKIIISQKESKTRLDKFLVQKIPKYSRAWIQKLIKTGLVLVNQKKVSPHYFLKQGDKLEIELKEPEPIDLSPKKGKIDIIFEDENFLVINKPAGLVVHPSLACKKDTLVNLLLDYFPEIKNVGDNEGSSKAERSGALRNLRPGIVHRLDKDVSGLMVIAKTQKVFDHLKEQFKNRRVKKEYLVLVHGKVKELRGRISFPITRSKKKGFKMIVAKISPGRTQKSTSKGWWASQISTPASPASPGALAPGFNAPAPGLKFKPAETFFEVIKYFPKHTLLKIQTKTGRTHQIRVHLNAIGHPIVGEKIYKPRKTPGLSLGLGSGFSPRRLDKLFLHACTLGFYDLEGKWREFIASDKNNVTQRGSALSLRSRAGSRRAQL